MDILTISNSKIKISLTRSEALDYSLEGDGLDYDTTETRRAIWSVLDDAKKSSGFDAAKSRIFLQMFTCADGGCELFVTRLEGPETDNIVCCGNPVASLTAQVYAFDCMNDLISACCLLDRVGYSFESSLFLSNERYFLLLECPKESGHLKGEGISYPDLLCEFGSIIDTEYAAEYITEHFECLCKHSAVQRLSLLKTKGK